MEDITKEKMALEELHLLYKKYDEDADHLDTKGSYLLSSSSLILTLFSVLKLTLLQQPQSIIYQIALVILFILYIVLVCLILLLLSPRKYKTVFEENWEGVEKAILHKNSEKDAIMQIVSNYLDRIQHNKKNNECKAKILFCTTRLFAVQMVLIVILSLFSFR